MLQILGTMTHILLPPSWVAFMARFTAPIYLFRECHFENKNLKMRKQLKRKIECCASLEWAQQNLSQDISTLPNLFLGMTSQPLPQEVGVGGRRRGSGMMV